MLKEEHRDFLNNLQDWMPWVSDTNDAASHLKTEFPALTIDEARVIVDHWMATKPKLLNEEDQFLTGC